MKNGLLFTILLILSMMQVNAFIISDQGVGIRHNGALVQLGNLNILMYRDATGGSPIYNETFPNVINAGSWSLQLDVTGIQAGETLYKDYIINGENIAFHDNIGNNIDRLPFSVPVGETAFFTNYYNVSSMDALLLDKGHTGSCPANYVVQSISDTNIICVPLNVNTSLYYTRTEINGNFSNYYTRNEINYNLSQKAHIGNCPTGTVIQNITASGINCVVVTFDLSPYYNKTESDARYIQTETDPIWNSQKSQFFNKSKSELITGDIVFSPLGNISFNTGIVLFDTPTYFRSNVTITTPRSSQANTSFYITDISGTPQAILNVSGFTGYLNLLFNGISQIKLNAFGDSYLNGGNVGIGTQNPTELLDVNGNIKANNIFANWNGSANYYTKSEINNNFSNYFTKSEINSALTNYYNKSQSDSRYLQSFTESDPIWNSQKSNYYMKNESDLRYEPIGTSYTKAQTNANFSHYYNKTQSDSRYLQSFVESDPVWVSQRADYYTKSQVDANFSKYYNKTISDFRYLMSMNESDPIWNSQKSNYYNKSEINASFYPNTNPKHFINSTYNATYNKWAYNQTAPAINYTNTHFYNKTQSDGRYLQSYSETDPVWSSQKIHYYNASQIDSTLTHYYNKTQSDARYLMNESEPTWNAEKVNYYNKTQVDSKINGVNTTENIMNLGFYNSTYLDQYLMMGGTQIYWLTNNIGTSGYRNLTIGMPVTGALSTISKPIGSSRVSLGTFISPKHTTPVVDVAGVRNLRLNARVTDAGKLVNLQGSIYLCKYNSTTDTCDSKTFFKNTTDSSSLNTMFGEYIMSYYQDLFIINTTTRFIINITALKTSGGATNVELNVDDSSYSRFEVPSPVGVTDITGKLDKTDQRYNDTTFMKNYISQHNASWVSTYNATYDKWAYNQSLEAINKILGYHYYNASSYRPRYGGFVTSHIPLDNGDGTMTLQSEQANLYATADGSGLIQTYTLIGGTTGSTLPAIPEGVSYLVGYYNGGTPIFTIIQDFGLVHQTNYIIYMTILREGTELQYTYYDGNANAMAERIDERLVRTDLFKRESGLTMTELSNRVINISTGITWIGSYRNFNPSTQTNKTNTILWYHNSSGSWVEQTVTQYNNQQYDNGTGLQDVGTDNYTVNWIYESQEVIPELYMVLGNKQYSTLADAITSSIPGAIAPEISTFGELIGRIVVQKNANHSSDIGSAFTQTISVGGVSNHNDLSGLQGGQPSQYYHLTGAEKQTFADLNAVVKIDANNKIIGINSLGQGTATIQIGTFWQNRTGTLLSRTYDSVNNETTVDIIGGNHYGYDASALIKVSGIKYYVNGIFNLTRIFVRGNITFLNVPYEVKSAPYADVFGDSNSERGYTISDEHNNWKWAMYIPDTSNDTKLCFSNSGSSLQNLDVMCLENNGNVTFNGMIVGKIRSVDVLNPYWLNISDQRYNDTTFARSINTSIRQYITNNLPAWTATYNVTYNKWAYNQTAPANAYTDNQLTNYYTKSQINGNFSHYYNKTQSDTRYLTNLQFNALSGAYLNRSKDEKVFGNYMFTPTSNITFNSGKILFDTPVYFRSNVTITTPRSGKANTTFYVTDISGNPEVVLNVTGIIGYLNLMFNGNPTIHLSGNGDSYLNGGNVMIGSSGTPSEKLEVSGNVKANNFLGAWNGSTNYYTKSQINGNFSNYFTKTAYWSNATTTFYTKSQINNNFTNYYTKAQINNNLSNYYTKTVSDGKYYLKTNPNHYINSTYNATYNKWAYNQTAPANAYTDSKLLNYYTVTQINGNFSNYFTKTAYWSNATTAFYTKAQENANFSKYYTKSQINNNFSNYYTKSQINNNLSNYYTKTVSDGKYYLATNPKHYINSTYNATYNKWAYNQTAPANAYTDSKLLNYYTIAQINNNFSNYFTKTAYWSNATTAFYTKAQENANLSKYYTKIQINGNFSGYFTKTAYWSNATASFYTKSQINNNFTNYYTKSQINANFSNYYTKTADYANDTATFYTKGQSNANWTKYVKKTGQAGMSGDFNGAYNITTTGNITANQINIANKTLYSNTNGVYVQALQPNFFFQDDFLMWQTVRNNMLCAGIGGGSASTASGEPNHPGEVAFSGGGNKGYACRTDSHAFSFGGGEGFKVRFKPKVVTTTVTTVMGFGDSTTVSDPTRGCYVKSVNNVLTGYCSNGGAVATGTTYTMTSGTWYTLVGKLNSASSVFTFYLYNDAGTLLWTNTVSSNIPVGVGQETGAEIYSYSSGSGTNILATYDSFEAWIDRPMGRVLN